MKVYIDEEDLKAELNILQTAINAEVVDGTLFLDKEKLLALNNLIGVAFSRPKRIVPSHIVNDWLKDNGKTLKDLGDAQ